ncbi:conjugal transfer protein [Lactiplantibacillus paraplantarum]|nr:conjugal transfer protein [Lactiplantibacillus paraplantarum]
MNFAVSGVKAILDQLNTSLPIIDKWYGVFLAFATSMVVVVVLARIIMTLIGEADESTDVTWANIIIDAVKSAVAIPIFVFLQGFLQTRIILPLAKGMFDMSGKFSADAVYSTSKVTKSLAITGFMQILFLAFFAIVTVAFFIKMCIYFADMAWYNLSIPIVAMSIASQSFDYSSTWWKKLVYYNISMLSQVLSLTLAIWCFTHIGSKWSFVAFMGAIGFGWLVLHTPHVIQDFWASTGITKGAGRSVMRGMGNIGRGMLRGRG